MNSNFKLTVNFTSISSAMALAVVLPFFAHAEQAGKTIMSRGDVVATDSSNASQRDLKRRSPIYNVDVVNTGESSQAQLRMQDGALIALKAQTQLKIEEYSQGSAEGGSVVMELISGGLRTITGEIKGDKNNYKLKTPVGSIGIRGTHYEVEWKNNELFLAVWDGTIELDMSGATGAEGPVLLGKGGDFSFAKVSESGSVTSLLKPPSELSSLSSSVSSSAQSNDTEEQGTTVASAELDPAEQPTPILEGSFAQVANDVSQNEFINEQELDSLGTADIGELISERTGSTDYTVLESINANSSLGAVSAINMQMTVNFDRGTVEQGALSFQDSGGEWFAAFNGLITTEGMDLGVNFASHGNNLANGTIRSRFIDGLEKLSGDFNLREIDNTSVTARGDFLLGQP